MGRGHYRRWGKPLLDLILLLVALPLALPLLLALTLTGAWVWRGNPLYTQIRPGHRGQPLRIYKLRSMRRGPGTDAQRLTAYGRWLRRTSLDELPQLLNIALGRMSWVGPRPLLMQYLPLYNARQAMRHSVKPGLTGLAQVAGRNALDWPTRLELDARYAEKVTLWLDLRILLRTAVIVLSGYGVRAVGHTTMPLWTGNL